MKTKKLFSLFTTGILATTLLVGCSSHQSDNSQQQATGEKVQSAEAVKPVGFIELANENTERIWFVAGEIAKDENITGLYVIKNGKATYYHLLTYTANNGVEGGPNLSDERLTFSDIKDLSNKEIIEKAKKLDKEAYDSYFQSFSDIVDTALQEWPNEKTGEYKIYIPALETIKSSLSSLQGDSAYKDYRKRVTDQPLTASVKTDDSGNNITNEEIELQIFPEYEADFVSSKSLELFRDTDILKVDASSFNTGDIYDSKYVSFGDIPLITRDHPKNTYPSLDSIDTKNITEE
ncbi:hypothetical protein [Streptococcus suis]|uniref:hypothetical protein n=1 Tax=Streptococcus suis TaxID=1307 RepID=UPI002FCCA3D1